MVSTKKLFKYWQNYSQKKDTEKKITKAKFLWSIICDICCIYKHLFQAFIWGEWAIPPTSSNTTHTRNEEKVGGQGWMNEMTDEWMWCRFWPSHNAVTKHCKDFIFSFFFFSGTECEPAKVGMQRWEEGSGGNASPTLSHCSQLSLFLPFSLSLSLFVSQFCLQCPVSWIGFFQLRFSLSLSLSLSACVSLCVCVSVLLQFGAMDMALTSPLNVSSACRATVPSVSSMPIVLHTPSLPLSPTLLFLSSAVRLPRLLSPSCRLTWFVAICFHR